ncbi:MAG: hypothetical protein N2067_08750 [Spirochaetaceae bacterium]|nr:hypothetical protein [Spirochaetaceae bacterium]
MLVSGMLVVLSSCQLLGGLFEPKVTSVAVGDYHTLIVKSDGSLWVCGFNQFGQLGDGTNMERIVPYQIMDGVKALSTGHQHSVVLKKDGTV